MHTLNVKYKFNNSIERDIRNTDVVKYFEYFDGYLKTFDIDTEITPEILSSPKFKKLMSLFGSKLMIKYLKSSTLLFIM
jgi:hypothetical protein